MRNPFGSGLPLLGAVTCLTAGALCLMAGGSLATGDDSVPPPATLKRSDAPTTAAPTAGAPQAGGRDVGHMHNVREITPRIVRGSAPEGESDFALLAKLGVKVVVSVDGATPDVASARKHGLRYVHVPFGYGGVPRAQQVLLYKAFTTLDGPFFVHCHHGKHRGPAACAMGLLGTEGWTAAQVTAEMKLAGTAARYDGLYAVAGAFRKPTAEELASAPKEIPEITPAAPFTQAMVDLDEVFDRLQLVRKAAWAVPADHPDVDPKHEAAILAEAFRELARRDLVRTHPADFAKHLADSETAAWDLTKALAGKTVDGVKAEAAYQRIQAICSACHATYRDAAHPAPPALAPTR